MMIDVQPSLASVELVSGVLIEAHVAAEPPRPLTWRLTVSSVGPGGSSSIVQGGRTDGSRAQPVGTVSLNASGRAHLQVFEGEQLVGETTKTFEPASAVSPSTSP